jgi:transposase InsO family protein
LKPVEVQAPFQQWGIDFIGEIANKSSGGHSWILVATDYFTKWVEAIPTRNSTTKVVTNFILNNIIVRFGCPERIVSDNAMCFRSKEYRNFCDKYGITRSTSSPYHPQGNGQAESSNKSLLKILKRILDENKKAWDSKLPLAIWADRVTIKKEIGCAPFDLVYGIHAKLS